MGGYAVKISPDLLAELENMPDENWHALIVGLLLGVVQSIADLQGSVDAHTMMLGKICRQVGVSEFELRSAAKRVRDAG